ncbi:hypothetical protein JRO89_XS03G0028000 [Xanthoceras sorbifolium]|uniref:Uncharacterized protein n=1 Tax=Xanthoceras sorbifolium TaxID=99658 RepID=A0ABQ8I8D7_9ROSI|nr:hypothetical protein JRO89_XS03G0028000 [Xanthoceras sorbifolium]
MQDTFKVSKIDADGKKFDKVSRIEAESESLEMYMKLDVNIDVYPIKKNEKFVVLLTSTLNKDGSAVSDYYTQSIGNGRDSTADKFEYIMQGKIFKIQDEGSAAQIKVEIYISFSGLLMMLKGNPSYVSEFQLDQKVFLCMRRL